MSQRGAQFLTTVALASIVLLAQSVAFAHQENHALTPDTLLCDTCLIGHDLVGGGLAPPVAVSIVPPSTSPTWRDIKAWREGQIQFPYAPRAPPILPH